MAAALCSRSEPGRSGLEPCQVLGPGQPGARQCVPALRPGWPVPQRPTLPTATPQILPPPGKTGSRLAAQESIKGRAQIVIDKQRTLLTSARPSGFTNAGVVWIVLAV